MSIKQLNIDEGPADSAVQNRLTVAGLVLTTLFFSGSFALALNAQFDANFKKDFRNEFAYLEVALIVGALLAVGAIAGFLACQQLAGSSDGWHNSKRAWFIVSTNLLYIALAQAMSAGLTELVYGVGVSFEALALARVLSVAATVVWIVLLYVGPIQALHSWWKVLRRGERVLSVCMYLIALLFALCANATIYLLQNGSAETLGVFMLNLAQQLIQPMMWFEPWDRAS